MSIKVCALDSNLVIRDLPVFYQEKTLDEISRKLPQGLYSTFRTYFGAQKVIGLGVHLNRIFVKCEEAGIKPSVTSDGLRLGIRRLLQEFGPKEARVRICLSLLDQPGQIFVLIENFKPVDEDIIQHGVSVVTTGIVRTDPRIKSTEFINKSQMERQALAAKGIYEALITRNEQIMEGMTSNFYAVQNSKVITARNGILLGVTRRVILRLIRVQAMLIEYRSLRIAELPSIDEAFITSSSRGVVPVVCINGITVGEGKPGNITNLLRATYDTYVAQKAETI